MIRLTRRSGRVGTLDNVTDPVICDTPNLALAPGSHTTAHRAIWFGEDPSHSEEPPMVEPLQPLIKASDMQAFEGPRRVNSVRSS